MIEYFKAGMDSCRNGDYRNGISLFDQALAIDPGHLESLYNRAKAKYKINAIEECLVDFDHAIQIAPQNPDLYSERAVVFYRVGNSKAALNDLTVAIKLDSNNAYRYASRAYIRDKYGDHMGAIEDYSKAVELDPEDAISYNNKGLVEEKLGLKNESLASFQNADRLTGYKKNLSGTEKAQGLTKSSGKENNRHVRSHQKVKQNNISVWKIIKQIFTSRDGRNDFIVFVLDIFKKKK